jgi:tetratricopeptide (TPR) repeat protein
MLLVAVPWVVLAFGDMPKSGASKKSRPATKNGAPPTDVASLPAPERHAALIEKTAAERRKRADEKQKAEQALARKEAARLEGELKSANPEEAPAVLYDLAVACSRAGNGPKALATFQQTADLGGEWGARARIHLCDILLYEKHDLTVARAALDLDLREAGAGDAPIVYVPPKKTAGSPLSNASVSANIAVRRALLDFIEGKSLTAPSAPGGSAFWGGLGRWKPEYGAILKVDSDAAWLGRLAEIHFAANDAATVMPLATSVVTSRNLHPTPLQKSFALFRRAKAAYQLHAALQPSERGLKEAIADYELAVKSDKDAPWCGDALFLAGNIHWNQFNDAERAIKLWKDAAGRYPKSRLAESASYNIGAIYQHNGEAEKAKTAFAEFRTKYPESKFLTALNDDGLAAHIKAVPPKTEAPATSTAGMKSGVRKPKSRSREQP